MSARSHTRKRKNDKRRQQRRTREARQRLATTHDKKRGK